MINESKIPDFIKKNKETGLKSEMAISA